MHTKIDIPISERNGQTPSINKAETITLESHRTNNERVVLSFGPENRISVNTAELYAAVECFARLSARKQ